MLIIGAKGFAKEVLQIFHDQARLKDLAFFDDVNPDGNVLFNTFPIIKSEDDALLRFSTINNHFTIGLGKPVLRTIMAEKFRNLGGQLVSVISDNAKIGSYDVHINEGVIILDNVCISNSVTIGEGCMIYYNSIITHDCILGSYVEIAPSVTILGRSVIGDYTQIGANATILPDIKIGKYVLIGAGAVVTKDIPDNSVAIGIPAKIVRFQN